MKKLMMMAVMFVASATAFAGDSDVLKAILKAKTYAEAEQLVKSTLDQLASPAEKAKAYNKLVELAYEPYNVQNTIVTENQYNKQVGKEEKPVDVKAMIENGMLALNNALECDKYDVMPNEKNKIKPAFQKKNQDIVQQIRRTLIIEGYNFANDSEKNQETFDCLDTYLSSAETPLMKDLDAVKNDPDKGGAAFYAGRAALNLEKNARAAELFKIGAQDTAKQVRDLCFDLLIYSMGLNLKNAEDSVKYENELNNLYVEYPENEQIFSSLANLYTARDDFDKIIKFADDHLAKYPSSAFAHVYKANTYQLQKKYDEAIAEWSLVPESTPNYVNFIYNRAVSKLFKANAYNDANADTMGRLTPDKEAKYKEMLNDALVDFEKTKELDPDQLKVKWGYLLKNVYTATGQQEKADAIF